MHRDMPLPLLLTALVCFICFVWLLIPKCDRAPQTISFEDWLDQLHAEAAHRGLDAFYTTTGTAWFDYYTDGLTPPEALSAAMPYVMPAVGL